MFACASTPVTLAPARRRGRHHRVHASRSRALASDDEDATLKRVIDFARSSRTLNDAIDASAQADIDALIANGRVDGGITNAVRGDGQWDVFCAPHIQRLATPVGVRFHPLRYVIEEGKIRSDVRHGGAWVPDGWLSASGTVSVGEEMTCEGRLRPSCVIKFDKFWIGAREGDASAPRDWPENGNAIDRAIDAIGSVGFLESFARFPVLFYDEAEGLVIFQFPPLSSNICALRGRCS